MSVNVIVIDFENTVDDALSMLSVFTREAIPVAIVSSAPTKEFQVVAFEGGAADVIHADDPLKLLALKLRRLAALRRTDVPGEDRAVFFVGDLVLDPRFARVTIRNSHADLTEKQFQLLYLLAENHGNFVHRRVIGQLLKQDADSRGLDMLVSRIRNKLREIGGEEFHLAAEYGQGYKLSVVGAPRKSERRIEGGSYIGKSNAIRQIQSLMVENRISFASLKDASKSRDRTSEKEVGTKRTARPYVDPVTGAAWSGRGFQPKWLKAALASGKKLEDF